jgi:hypothetical protein
MLEGFTDGTTKVDNSVGDSDPDVFRPPRSGPISQMVRIRILPFSHTCVEQTEIMPAK